ncbi:tyrosine-protein phosphatase [Aquibacillus rhizosphaerae]|uniref:Tyrosine-protein phosphatase n=1 Tax=Aquibacillus rhizosphaerae TaxID=3051431 RepID=A0ABT7L2Z0_9BACI|nr:CpsB/CapC family capsule biosynthesis tyrosine phosphatase [Aquibacillus sp. LR5S19]MDL4838971.1 tyrosine protein phosphatase [Aquibacillus sp. LR5S19]
MIDIHSHILIDNNGGAKHTTESLSVARKAHEQGIDKIIATPNLKADSQRGSKIDLVKQVHELNKRLMDEGVPVTVLPGQKMDINQDILALLNKGYVLPLNATSDFIFIELPTDHMPVHLRNLLFDIQVHGYQIIISQPETNRLFMENSDLLYEMVKNGAFIQISASSIVGKNGRKVQKFTQQLIEANLVHFVASSATENSGVYLEEAYAKLEKQFGLEKVYSFIENTQAIIDNASIFIEEPFRIQKRKSVLGLLK